MAITIKSIPILKEKEAENFEKIVTSNENKKATINFNSQLTITSKILAKAKLK